MSAAPSIPESSATLEAAQAGLLYERYSGKILGYCRRRLSSREEAEDAVQHTFLNAYRSLRTGVVPRAEAAWLYKIAENVCHERRRSAWRRSRLEIVSDDGELREAVATPMEEHHELAGLADALAELTPNQRRAILLREWQGLTYREIAAELDTTESAVETLLFRARGALARKLDRGRAWNGLNLGSLVGWGKSLLGGVAAKVTAATVVVAAGLAAGAPALQHQLPGGGSQGSAPASSPAAPATLQVSFSAGALAPASDRVDAPSGRVEPRTTTPARPTTEATGTRPVSAPAPGNVPTPDVGGVPSTLPVVVPPPPPLPVHVEVPPVPPVPPLPPLTVEVPPAPPLPPLPPVELPDLPIVPPVPELPKLL
jgi:RNA polymerase sigma-70 factor (ECF subfamily)